MPGGSSSSLRTYSYEPRGRGFESCRARQYFHNFTRARVTAALYPILCPLLSKDVRSSIAAHCMFETYHNGAGVILTLESGGIVMQPLSASSFG